MGKRCHAYFSQKNKNGKIKEGKPNCSGAHVQNYSKLQHTALQIMKLSLSLFLFHLFI